MYLYEVCFFFIYFIFLSILCVKDFYASIIIVNNKELFDLIVLVLGGRSRQ